MSYIVGLFEFTVHWSMENQTGPLNFKGESDQGPCLGHSTKHDKKEEKLLMRDKQLL